MIRGLRRMFRLRRMQKEAASAFGKGNYQRAYELFRDVLKEQDERPGVRNNLALACVALEKYKEAEALFRLELKRYGDHYPRLKVLADLYYISGQRERANEFYRRALACEAPLTEQPLLKARLDVTATEDGYRNVVASHAAYTEGNRLMNSKQYAEALEYFERAAELDPTSLHALNNAGTMYLNHLKDAVTAERYFRRALEWSPLPWIVKNVAHVERVLAREKRKAS